MIFHVRNCQPMGGLTIPDEINQGIYSGKMPVNKRLSTV